MPWFRLIRLLQHRGLLTDAPAIRFAGYLAAELGGQGVIADLPGLLRGYAQHARVSVRTAWADLRRLVDRGLLRQLQAAAPGIPARYRLSFPAAVVASMPGLPPDLCGQLHTSPSMGEGSPPSPAGQPRNGRPAASQHRPGGERDEARELLARCAAQWRGRLTLDGRLEAMTAISLRYATPGDVAQLLTERTGSARDLAGVLRWRLGRVISSARRSASVRADETGDRYRQMLTTRRPGPGAEARAEIARTRQRITLGTSKSGVR